MKKSPQKQQRLDVKHFLLGLLFVFSCLLMSGCSDDDTVSQANQDVGAWLLPGGGVQIHATLTLDLNKELNWYRKSITDDSKGRAVKNVSAVLEDGQILETTLEEEGNYMHAKVHFKPPRTGSVKFTIVYSLENAVCKIEDNGHQKLRLSWFEEYEHKVPKSTFRLRAIVGSPELENACFGEETSGALECLAATPSDNDAVAYSTEELLEPAFQWSSPVVSETACPVESGLPGWAPWAFGIGGFVCCSWSLMLVNCLFKSHGIPEKYPRFWAVWHCPVKTAKWIDAHVGGKKGGDSSSAGGGGGCGGGGGGCGGGG